MGKALIDQDSADRLPVPLEDHEVAAVPVPRCSRCAIISNAPLLSNSSSRSADRRSQRFFAGALRRQQFRGVYPGNADLPITKLERVAVDDTGGAATRAAGVKLVDTRSGAAASSPTGAISDGSSRAPASSRAGINQSARRTSVRLGLNEGGRRFGLNRVLAMDGD